MLNRDTLQLVHDRTKTVKGEMSPSPIVNVIETVNEQASRLFVRQIKVIKDLVHVEGAVGQIHNDIVPTVSLSAGAADDPTVLDPGLALVAGVGTLLAHVVDGGWELSVN